MTASFAAPGNRVYGCVVRAGFCTVDAPVALCTMVMMQAATVWIVGEAAGGKSAHSWVPARAHGMRRNA